MLNSQFFKKSRKNAENFYNIISFDAFTEKKSANLLFFYILNSGSKISSYKI